MMNQDGNNVDVLVSQTSHPQASEQKGCSSCANGEGPRSIQPLMKVIKALAGALTRYLLNADEAAGRLGISRTHFYSLNSSGELGPRPIKLGDSSRWRAAELEAWVAARCPPREQWQAMMKEKTDGR